MMSNLQNQIGDLSIAEKFELLDTLWESIEADAPSLSKEQEEELDSRIARYDQNPCDVVTWEQVRADLFKTR